MAIVNEVGLRKMIRERNISGAILIYGDESYLKEHYLKSIVTKTIGKGQREFNEIIFDFKDVDYITLQESVDGIPLMSEKKCVIIRSIDPDKLTDKDLKQLEGIVADVPEYTVFIVYIDNVDWNVKKSSKCRRLLKIFENSGTAAEISKRTASSIVKFLCDKAEKSGCVLSKENAAKLLERVGNDIRTLDNELEKLCLMCGEGEITASHIESAIPKRWRKTYLTFKTDDKARCGGRVEHDRMAFRAKGGSHWYLFSAVVCIH